MKTRPLKHLLGCLGCLLLLCAWACSGPQGEANKSEPTDSTAAQTDTAQSSEERFPKLGQKVPTSYWADSLPDSEEAQGLGVSEDFAIGGYWIENRKGLWGYVDEDSVLRIPPRYQETNNTDYRPFIDSIALRQLPNGRWHYLRPTGELVHETSPQAKAHPFRPAQALVAFEESEYQKQFMLADLQHRRPKLSGKGQKIKAFRNGVAPMRFGNDWHYIDRNFKKEPLCDLQLDYASELIRLGNSNQAVGHIRQRKGDEGGAYWNRADSLYWFWRTGLDHFLQGMVEKNTRFDAVEYAGRGRLLILERAVKGGPNKKALARITAPTPPPKNQALPPGPPSLELVTDFKFTELEPFSEGKAAAAVGGAFPRFYLEAQSPLPERANPRADTLTLSEDRGSFEKGQEVVVVRGFMLAKEALPRVGYLRPDGSWALQPRAALRAADFSEGKAALFTPEGWHFIDSSGAVLFEGRRFQSAAFLEGHYGASKAPHLVKLRPPHFRDGRAAVVADSGYGILNAQGQWVKRPGSPKLGGRHYRRIAPYHEGLARIDRRQLKSEKGPLRWGTARAGFLGRDGEIAIERNFDRARDFREGRAAVFQEGKGWGFIDKRGQVVVPLKYDKVRDFRAGRAAVFLEEGPRGGRPGWGFVGRQGEVTIRLRNDGVKDYTGGRATIRTEEGRYTINRQGQKIEYNQK